MRVKGFSEKTAKLTPPTHKPLPHPNRHSRESGNPDPLTPKETSAPDHEHPTKICIFWPTPLSAIPSWQVLAASHAKENPAPIHTIPKIPSPSRERARVRVRVKRSRGKTAKLTAARSAFSYPAPIPNPQSAIPPERAPPQSSEGPCTAYLNPLSLEGEG